MRAAIVIKKTAKGAKASHYENAAEARTEYHATELKPGESVELWESDRGRVKNRKPHVASVTAAPSFAKGAEKLSAQSEAENGNPPAPVKADADKIETETE